MPRLATLIALLALSTSASAQVVAQQATLQQRIDDGYGRGPVALLYGEEEITTTVLTGNKTGLVVNGRGSINSDNPDSSLTGSRTAIVWGTSNTSLPMVDLRGTRQVWRDMVLHGDAWNAATSALDKYGGKPTAGFLVSYDAGLGSGNHRWENILFRKMAAGIQFAEAYTDNNCDMSSGVNLAFSNVDKGIYLKGGQSHHFTFEHLYASGNNVIVRHASTSDDWGSQSGNRWQVAETTGETEWVRIVSDDTRGLKKVADAATCASTSDSWAWVSNVLYINLGGDNPNDLSIDFCRLNSLFYVEAGGKITCISPNIINRGTILTLSDVGLQVGANAGDFTFVGTQIDAGAAGTCFVDMTADCPETTDCDITFIGGNASYNDTSYDDLGLPAAVLRGETWITFRDYRFRVPLTNALEYHTDDVTATGAAVYFFDGCRLNVPTSGFDPTTLIRSNSTGDVTLILNNCRSFHGGLIYDPNNVNAEAEGDTHYVEVISQ